MANQGFAGSIPGWMQYARHLQIKPTVSTAAGTFGLYRIPRPAPDPVDTAAVGLICWGSTGSMPSPEPMPTFGFNVKPNEEWKEWGRQSERVRVENPDDKSQYIMDNRPKVVGFDKKEHGTAAGSNTATEQPPGMVAYENTDAFVRNDPQGKPEKLFKVRVHYVSQTAPTETPVPS